jgi:hypothetical protein
VASTDPLVRRIGGRLFIINRYGQDNVTVLEADDLSLVAQVSTGPGSNPQDVAVVGDTLFVAALAAPGVLVLDLARPDAGVVDTIDLSDLDPDDGLPNCGTIAAAGDEVIAVCGILDDGDMFLTPRGPGVAAVIDAARRSVTERVTLSQIRPFGMAQLAGTPARVLLMPTVQDFLAPGKGGCVEQILVGDGAGEGSRAAGCLVGNAELGGFVSGLAWDPAGERVWLTVTTSFDPDDFGARGELVSTGPDGADLQRPDLGDEVRPMDVALCPSGHLVLSDATRGVRVLAPGAETELTSGPLDIGLPPVSNGLVCY